MCFFGETRILYPLFDPHRNLIIEWLRLRQSLISQDFLLLRQTGVQAKRPLIAICYISKFIFVYGTVRSMDWGGLCVLERGSCYRNLRCERFIVLKTSFSRQNLWCLSLYHTILWQNLRCWTLMSSVNWRLKIRLSSVTCKSHIRMNKVIVACFANISMAQSSVESLKNSRVLVVRSSSSG